MGEDDDPEPFSCEVPVPSEVVERHKRIARERGLSLEEHVTELFQEELRREFEALGIDEDVSDVKVRYSDG